MSSTSYNIHNEKPDTHRENETQARVSEGEKWRTIVISLRKMNEGNGNA